MKVQSRMSRYNILNPDHVYTCNKTHGSFHEYFHCHCLYLSNIAKALYYAGVFALVLTATLLVYARFMLKFRAPYAAMIFAAVIVAFLLFLVVLEKFVAVGPRLSEEDFKGHSTLRATLAEHRAQQRLSGLGGKEEGSKDESGGDYMA